MRYRISLLFICLLLSFHLRIDLVFAEQSPTAQKQIDVPIARPKGEERPVDKQPTLLWGRPLTFSGELEIESRDRRNRSLRRRDDDDNRISTSLQLETLYSFSESASLYFKLTPSYRSELYSEDGETEDDSDIKLEQVWLYFPINSGKEMSIRIGRQYLGDGREWWLDDELDALQFLYRAKPLKLSVTLGKLPDETSLLENDSDAEDKDIFWLIAHANWRWKSKHQFELFLLSRIDQSSLHEQGKIVRTAEEDESDANLNWLGLRQSGRLKLVGSRWQYWLDLGFVAGRETRYDFDETNNQNSVVDERIDHIVSGWGFDVGLTWELPWRTKPRFTWAYASGSGDKSPNNSLDTNYRQTGLHSNDDRYRGVNSFRYYGELLRPELSNLSITTMALGFSLSSEGSVEIVYHQYSQHHASDELRNVSLRTDPDGNDTNIGHEINAIFGFEYWENIEVEFIIGQFRAGDAYGEFSGRHSSKVTLEFEYNF